MMGGNPNHPHAFTYILTSYYLSHLHPKGGSSNTPKKDPCLGRGVEGNVHQVHIGFLLVNTFAWKTCQVYQKFHHISPHTI
jgi:hypothetical protein